MALTPEESLSAVYEQICQASSPWEPPNHFAKMPSSTSIYCGVENASLLLKSLQERFTSNQLRAAGVVREVAGSLQLHPELVGKERPWIAPVDNFGWCLDIIVDSGCISGRDLPLFVLARDSIFRSAVNQMRPVMITCSTQAAAGFRYLGIPAATAIGLDRLKKSTLTRFRRLLGQDYNSPSPSDDDRWTVTGELIFSTWSPVLLRTADPKLFQPTISHFEKLQQHLGIRLANVLFWDPAEDSQRRIKFVMEHDEPKDIRCAIIEAAMAESTRLRQPVEPPAPKLQTPAELLRGLSLWHGGNSYAVEKASAELAKYIDSRLVEPLLAEADASPDPIERNLRTILAGLCQQAHRGILAHMVRQEPTAGSHGDFCDDFSQLSCLIDQILRLSRQLGSPDSVPRLQMQRIKSRFKIRF